MTFESWLKKQKDRDDQIGDLAKDFIYELKNNKNIKCNKEHLLKHHACKEAHQALNKAIKEWEAL